MTYINLIFSSLLKLLMGPRIFRPENSAKLIISFRKSVLNMLAAEDALACDKGAKVKSVNVKGANVKRPLTRQRMIWGGVQ